MDQYGYDVWGMLDLTSPFHGSEAVPQPLRYGGYWDDGWDDSLSPGTWDNGPLPWYWLQTRPYDPAIRRFVQPDPAATGSLPDYVYANDDPLDVSDPTGQAGVPSGCQSASYVSQGLNGALCEQRALHAGQQRAQAAFLAALNPLNAVFNPHASLGDRAFGVLGLVPFVGALGRGINLADEILRGLEGTEAVAGTITRQARAEALVAEAAQASGIADLSRYVDVVTSEGPISQFYIENGQRVVNIGSRTFRRTQVGQLMEAAHELVHAQQFDFALRQYNGDINAADWAFFDVSDSQYASGEVIAETLARNRISNYLGGLSPAQAGAATRYINFWQQYNVPLPLP